MTVTLTATGTADVLARVAAFGLPGPAGMISPGPLEHDAFADLLEDVVDQHLTGHLVAAIDGGSFATTAAQRGAAAEAHRQALVLDLTLERLLVHVSRRLGSLGIEHRALKGPAFAHTVYADPARRSFGDVDVLVRDARYDDAIASLAGLGGTPRYGEPRPRFTRRFGKGVCVEIDGLEVDVHRTFVSGPFGLTIDLDELFDAPVALPIGDGSVLALSPAAQLLHACYHVALGAPVPRLVPMRDVAEMLCRGDIDATPIVEQAARWRARAVVQHAIRCTTDVLGVTIEHPLATWATGYRPSKYETRALAAYVAPSRSYASQAIAGLHAVRGVRAKCAYAFPLLVPRRDYVGQRGGYVARLRVGVATARKMRAGA